MRYSYTITNSSCLQYSYTTIIVTVYSLVDNVVVVSIIVAS
jgi:hypothetical protein